MSNHGHHPHYLYEKAAVTIMKWLHLAEDDLVGHTVVTMNGEAGTVREIRLDDHHGLCFTLEEHKMLHDGDSMPVQRFYPVSTIKHFGPKDERYKVCNQG